MKGYGKYKIPRSCIVLLLGPWGALPLSSLRFENGIHSNENADIEMLPAKRTICVLETTEMSSCNLCILKFDNRFLRKKKSKINQFCEKKV